jgi:hypothetical protein
VPVGTGLALAGHLGATAEDLVDAEGVMAVSQKKLVAMAACTCKHGRIHHTSSPDGRPGLAVGARLVSYAIL